MRFLLAGLIFLMSACAYSTQVELYDRNTGQVLQTYSHRGRLYVEGEPGHEYEVRVRNQSGQRVLVVTTVDGVNVITGQTGAVTQSGYVLDPYGYVGIEGWRKSMSHTAAFYFTTLNDSYAARTGRPENVGVIGVAVFHEKVRCCARNEELRRDSSPAAAASLQESDKDAAGLKKQKAEEKLGTGHGRTEYSPTQYTEFERASTTPDETIVIYYDSHRNLIAQGVIPQRPRYAEQRPQPFPNGFVPDP
jgi:hypothetical protein